MKENECHWRFVAAKCTCRQWGSTFRASTRPLDGGWHDNEYRWLPGDNTPETQRNQASTRPTHWPQSCNFTRHWIAMIYNNMTWHNVDASCRCRKKCHTLYIGTPCSALRRQRRANCVTQMANRKRRASAIRLYPRRRVVGILNDYIEKLHTVYPMLYKPTLKNSKN